MVMNVSALLAIHITITCCAGYQAPIVELQLL